MFPNKKRATPHVIYSSILPLLLRRDRFRLDHLPVVADILGTTATVSLAPIVPAPTPAFTAAQPDVKTNSLKRGAERRVSVTKPPDNETIRYVYTVHCILSEGVNPKP